MAPPWPRKEKIPKILFLSLFLSPHLLLSLSTVLPRAMILVTAPASADWLPNPSLQNYLASCIPDHNSNICWTSPPIIPTRVSENFQYQSHSLLFQSPGFFNFVKGTNFTLVKIFYSALSHPIYLTHFLCLFSELSLGFPSSYPLQIVNTQRYTFLLIWTPAIVWWVVMLLFY